MQPLGASMTLDPAGNSFFPSTPSGYEINEGDITGSGMLRKNITAPLRVAL